MTNQTTVKMLDGRSLKSNDVVRLTPTGRRYNVDQVHTSDVELRNLWDGRVVYRWKDGKFYDGTND